MSKGRVSSCLKLLTHCAFHMWYVACKAPQFQVVFTLIVLIRSHTFFMQMSAKLGNKNQYYLDA